jgi:hypothetical protein
MRVADLSHKQGGYVMRLLVWILGVADALAGLMVSRHLAPGWQWFWWSFLGLWVVAGLVVLIAALARVLASGRGRSAGRVPAPLSTPRTRVEGGE